MDTNHVLDFGHDEIHQHLQEDSRSCSQRCDLAEAILNAMWEKKAVIAREVTADLHGLGWVCNYIKNQLGLFQFPPEECLHCAVQ